MQSRLNKASAMTYFCFTSLVMENEFDKMSLIPFHGHLADYAFQYDKVYRGG